MKHSYGLLSQLSIEIQLRGHVHLHSKLNMVATKPEVVNILHKINQDKSHSISAYRQNINDIPTALLKFWVQFSIGTEGNTVRPNRSGRIQYGVLLTSNAYIPAPRQDIEEIPTALPTFLGSSFPLGLMRKLCDQTGSGKIQDGDLSTSNACISASRQVFSGDPSVAPMFLGPAIQQD